AVPRQRGAARLRHSRRDPCQPGGSGRVSRAEGVTMLRIRDLRVGYGSASVLEGGSLDVPPGESLALLGRNGMGKTTLIRAITGLRPPTITGGSVELDDRVITGLAPHRITRAGVSLVPQGRQVFGSLTVQENLAIVPHPRGADDPWTVERV